MTHALTHALTLALAGLLFAGCGPHDDLMALEDRAGDSPERDQPYADDLDDDESDTREDDEPEDDDEPGDDDEEDRGDDEPEDDDEEARDDREDDDDPLPANIEPGAILTLGDSIVGWNRETGDSMAQAIGESMGRQLVDRSVGGALFSDGGIPGRYVDGPWSWVLFNGGGNDQPLLCDCGQCEAFLTGLISADGARGTMVDFAKRLADDGAQVMILGYYEPLLGDEDWDACRQDLATLSARQRQVAEDDPRIHFFDGRAVITPDNRGLYADSVHPSPEGAQRLGRAVAEAMRAVD